MAKTFCHQCKRSVRVDPGDYLATHRKAGGGRCDGSGRHISFNLLYAGAMHEPPPYPASSLQFNDDSYDHLHPFTD